VTSIQNIAYQNKTDSEINFFSGFLDPIQFLVKTSETKQ